MATQPDVGDLHVNRLLTNMSVGYFQEHTGFLADKIFPIIFSPNQSDVYAKYDKTHWFDDPGQKMLRAPGTKAARTGWEIDTTSTFRCDNYAIGTEIPDELRGNADTVFRIDADATRLVTEQQMIRRERKFVADFMVISKWTTDKTGGSDFTKWSDYASSDPIGDIEDYIQTVKLLIGRKPNTLAMGEIVWRRLKHHPDFLDRIKYGASPGNPALFTKEMFATWLEIDRVMVGQGTYNSASEGQDAVMADIWGDDALLCYVPSGPSLLTPAAGYTFVWQTATQPGAVQYIRKYREDPEKQDVIESFSYVDQVLTAADAGLFMVDAVD